MAEETSVKPPVEVVPTRLGDVSAIASAHAPFLYFDRAQTFGFNNGIVNVTLDAARYLPSPTEDGKVVFDVVVVAHLRMSVAAARSLRAALESALLIAMPSAGGDTTKPNYLFQRLQHPPRDFRSAIGFCLEQTCC